MTEPRMCIRGKNIVEIWYKRTGMEKEFSMKTWNKWGLGKEVSGTDSINIRIKKVAESL